MFYAIFKTEYVLTDHIFVNTIIGMFYLSFYCNINVRGSPKSEIEV